MQLELRKKDKVCPPQTRLRVTRRYLSRAPPKSQSLSSLALFFGACRPYSTSNGIQSNPLSNDFLTRSCSQKGPPRYLVSKISKMRLGRLAFDDLCRFPAKRDNFGHLTWSSLWWAYLTGHGVATRVYESLNLQNHQNTHRASSRGQNHLPVAMHGWLLVFHGRSYISYTQDTNSKSIARLDSSVYSSRDSARSKTTLSVQHRTKFSEGIAHPLHLRELIP